MSWPGSRKVSRHSKPASTRSAGTPAATASSPARRARRVERGGVTRPHQSDEREGTDREPAQRPLRARGHRGRRRCVQHQRGGEGHGRQEVAIEDRQVARTDGDDRRDRPDDEDDQHGPRVGRRQRGAALSTRSDRSGRGRGDHDDHQNRRHDHQREERLEDEIGEQRGPDTRRDVGAEGAAFVEIGTQQRWRPAPTTDEPGRARREERRGHDDPPTGRRDLLDQRTDRHEGEGREDQERERRPVCRAQSGRSPTRIRRPSRSRSA